MIKSTIHKLESVCLFVARVALIIMTLVTVAQVFFRYVLRSPFSWSEEATLLLQSWLVLIMAAVLVLRDDHIKLEFIVDLMKDRARFYITVVNRVLVLGFVVVLLIYGVRSTLGMAGIQSATLGYPMILAHAAVPLSAALMLVFGVYRLIADIAAHAAGRPSDLAREE